MLEEKYCIESYLMVLFPNLSSFVQFINHVFQSWTTSEQSEGVSGGDHS